MWFFKQCAIGLLVLQSSLSFASPTNSSLLDLDGAGSHLQKRYPVPVVYDSSVSASDRAIIDQAFQDMQTLALAAANYNFANSAANIDGIYIKYFPQGSEAKIAALFRYLAGVTQQWGGTQLTTPDFSRITIRRAAQSPSDSKDQADCALINAGFYVITIYDRALTDVSQTIAQNNFRGSQTSVSMESLGAILLHEMLHATALINPIQSFASATDPRLTPGAIIDDQRLGIFGKCYGGFFANMLKQQDAQKAVLNNDNFMYFALEAYYYPLIRPPGGFGKPVVDRLKGCAVVMGLTLFCYGR